MVPLPLFKIAALFVRHVSKYGANRIKAQAHDHPKFRAFAARYGQSIHQLNMRLSVALLRNVEAEMRAKEKAEAPTVKTKEQVEKEEEAKAKQAKLEAGHPEAAARRKTSSSSSGGTEKKPTSIWRRKFRSLPEAKAVDLFADVIGDAFILGVASAIIIYEYWKASQKPDQNAERIKMLDAKLEELTRREEELARSEEERQQRYEALENALRDLRDPKTKKPLFDAEANIKSHDIILPIPEQRRSLRLVLLSSADLDGQTTEQRVERLANLEGGSNAAVIFLVDPLGQKKDPMEAFMKLQIQMLDKHDIPLIPLASASDLPGALAALRSSAQQPPPQPQQSTPLSLLQHMTAGRPLTEHAANLLSELVRSPAEVAALAATPHGRARILDLLGEADGKRVLDFLKIETNAH
ncbi:opa3 domain protein [Colletotrichum kahawae]|uniref:Opa3 domain protein n=1 Tax=Colletotrichum kahawae TaxID=34407 RepID=A0AAD9Y1Z3_COLKA|nr:opa3 domain protein [Colletotrichum kahawae]